MDLNELLILQKQLEPDKTNLKEHELLNKFLHEIVTEKIKEQQKEVNNFKAKQAFKAYEGV